MAISSPGIGSNLDVSGIVSQLMAVESQPLTALQKKEASFQAKLTAYGSLKGALSSFQTSVAALADASKFQSLTATSSDSTVLSASASGTAAAGTYSINVSALAQSQTIATAGQSSSTSAIGSGSATTLTFQFGTISGGSVTSGKHSGATFNVDATQAGGTVVIDSSNNSLQGIRDAINRAGLGVTASIVNDGTTGNPYKLLISSNNTGLAKSMKISSSGEDAAISNLLSYDPGGTQNLTQTSAAQNASLTVNGLSITSASNSVSGAIGGATVNLLKTGTSTVTFSNNSAAVTTAMQSLVTAYNSINTTLNSLTRYNATTKQGGILLGDASIQNIQSRIRSTLSSALSGLGGSSLTNLSQVGLSFLKDGSLSLDNAKLQSALSNNYGDFAALFAAYGKSTDSLVSYVSATTKTEAGSYAVNVTTLATQGKTVGSDSATQARLEGSTAANLTITDTVNDQLSVSVDGGSFVTVDLTSGTYASFDALVAQVQSDLEAVLPGQVTVSHSSGKLSFTSNKFGALSAVDVANGGTTTGASDLLGLAPTSTRVTTIKSGVNDQLALGINGTTATVTLASGTYTASALAEHLQATVNSNATFSTAGISATVTQSSGVLTISSSRYGITSAVNVAGGSAALNLMGSAPTSTIGADVVGTINGVAATGSGQFLTGAAGDTSEGIKLQIVGGTTGSRGNINFSKGYAYNLNSLLDNFLSSAGTIASVTDAANRNIADLQKRAAALNVQLTATEKRYRAQFTALDTLIGKMNTTSSFLTQQLQNLAKMSSGS
ncbi:flagellar filament capping protein FliD [Noviherbaspirillum sp. CPCC 100848]|uniref:Flagellar hook-associated protein 2 n=1 Tax=Noviherbaspirillum album TaxID=3080276 RepID=A0ABU6JJG4_9BURK|nr:flagellar filament capping protein FliD [Noviherbaspirillum sp. CPCC 100848]MEC4723830.1 flagellar filament capping protein FliD [Noviherbaspirillum sp. CPCC 100848]